MGRSALSAAVPLQKTQTMKQRTSPGRRAQLLRRRIVIGTGAIAAVTVLAASRTWAMSWGATKAERAMPLAGDALLSSSELTATRAITISAAPAEVWPWIAQLGQDRGGFYSYDVLENLVGCDIHSAQRIEPRWQSVAVGQEFKLHPEVSMVAAVVRPVEALVLRGAVPVSDAAPPYESTWAFVLIEGPNGTTRLVSRERYHYLRPWAALLIEPTQLVSSVMSQRMLRGIKERVELTTK